MAKKRPNKAERQHMDRVAALGCIACMALGYLDSPAEIHPTRCDAGGAQRSAHTSVLPLCPTHHRIGGPGVALHAGQKTWEAKFGTETELLNQVDELLQCRHTSNASC